MTAFLDRWHWVWLLLAAPFLLFPSPARSLAMLGVPLVWLIAWRNTGQPLPPTPLNGLLLVLNVMILVSLLATYDISVSLPKITGMVLAMGVFFAVARAGRSTRGWWLALLAFFSAGAVVAGLGLVGTRWPDKISFLAAAAARLQSKLGGLSAVQSLIPPNEVAGALLWVLPVGLTAAVWLVARRSALALAFGRRRINSLIAASAVYVVVLGGVLVLSQSRGGVIALAVTMLALLSLLAGRRRRWKWLAVLWLAAALAAAAAWPIVTAGGSDVNVGNGVPATLGSLGQRLDIWSQAIHGIQDFPYTGMGMNAFRYVARVLYPPFSDQPDFDLAHAHNEYLQAALDLGLPGLVAFMGLYLAGFTMVVALVRQRNAGAPGDAPLAGQRPAQDMASLDPGLQSELTLALALALCSGLVAHLLFGLTDAVALGAKPGVLFWMLLGLLTSLYSAAATKPRAATSPRESRASQAV